MPSAAGTAEKASMMNIDRDREIETLLVRSVQHRKGLEECFRTGRKHCDRLDCRWRAWCLAPGAGSPDNEVCKSDEKK